jgi:hypothetical protein
LSKSEPETRPLTFDGWLQQAFDATGGFTALVVLVAIGELSVTPRRSTWFHVVGDALDWSAVARLLDGAGTDWDGAVFAARADPVGGPLPDPVARVESLALGERVRADRTVLNAEQFFDRAGRRIRVDAATAH